MKFGLRLFGMSARHYPAIARAAEAAGFESVWIAEHLVLPAELPATYPYRESGVVPIAASTPLFDPWVSLGAIAQATTRLRLATAVYILPLRHPIQTARAVITLDRISGGRVSLGVGVGWLEEEFEVMGVPFHQRGTRTDEAIDVIRRLWSDEVAEWEGEHYAFGPVRFEPKPVGRALIPIEVGGTSNAALRRAAVRGDGWIDVGSRDLADVAAKLARIEAWRREAGRAELPFEVSSPVPTGLADIDQARRTGVTRTLVRPAVAATAAPSVPQLEEWVHRFGESVISQVEPSGDAGR